MHNDNLPESGPAGGRRRRYHARRSVTMSQPMLDQISEIAAISRMKEEAIVRKALSAGPPAVRRAELTERERRRRNR